MPDEAKRKTPRKAVKTAQEQFERDSKVAREARRKAIAKVRKKGILGALLAAVLLVGCGGSEPFEDAGRSTHVGNRQAESFALAKEVCEEGPKSDFARDSVGLPADATDVEIARGYASQWGAIDQKAAFRGCLDGLERAPARFPSSSPAAGAPWERSFVMTSIEAVEEGEDLPVVQPSHIRVWFSSERDHGVSWKARCNGYGADARITARKIEISGMGSTLIGCPAPQGREDAWLTRFMEAMPEWRLEGERLQLSTDFATLRLRDVRAPAASGH